MHKREKLTHETLLGSCFVAVDSTATIGTSKSHPNERSNHSQIKIGDGSGLACLQYLEKLRWPDGFVCPRCGGMDEPYRAQRARLMCRACDYQGTVTAGTVFAKTRTPLRSWFAGVWYVTSQKHGVSALGLQRVLGLGSYQTAWTMLHRLRRAMVRPARERVIGQG